MRKYTLVQVYKEGVRAAVRFSSPNKIARGRCTFNTRWNGESQPTQLLHCSLYREYIFIPLVWLYDCLLFFLSYSSVFYPFLLLASWERYRKSKGATAVQKKLVVMLKLRDEEDELGWNSLKSLVLRYGLSPE